MSTQHEMSSAAFKLRLKVKEKKKVFLWIEIVKALYKTFVS